MADQSQTGGVGSQPDAQDRAVVLSRAFAWGTVAVLTAFLLNNYLSNWRDWPGPSAAFGAPEGQGFLAWIQVAVYGACIALALWHTVLGRPVPLRQDAARLYAISAYIVRAAFWAVLLIGLADMIVSFLRVEGFLPGLFGGEMATELGRSSFRGTYIHFPLVVLALILAAMGRGPGFQWLALLVVGAELLIVLSRFIFSYEQAFMADLVRFWYAALFLFASAHTLLEDGHVRVDVFYAAFSRHRRGVSNAWGTLLLGMPLCWVILYYGMNSKSTVINSPLLSYEVTQTGFGMYVKYWMAGFLGIFAITMLIQFSGYFLQAIADYRGDPGGEPDEAEDATPAPVG